MDDISDPKKACVDDMDLDNLKDEIKATEVFHVSAKTGYQVKDSMQLLEKIVSYIIKGAVIKVISKLYVIKHLLYCRIVCLSKD